jgi:hypothetical protein
VTILINFLNGELTIRFALKALAVFVIVTSAFLYYLLDARGYWQEHEKDSIRYAAVTSILICVAIVFGFIHTESPREVRELKIDATQIADLQNIQSHIEEYYHLKNTLPTTIKGTFMVNGSPEAPEGRAPYTYAVKDLMSFELCAEFTYPSRKSEREMYMQPAYYDGMILKNPNNWEHKSGKWCFERVVSKPSEVITKESL